MKMSGQRFCATHPKREKKSVIDGKKSRTEKLVERNTNFVGSRRPRQFYRGRKTAEEVLREYRQGPIFNIIDNAAINLAIAHAHRIKDVDSDDVATAFKSIHGVVGVPLKTVRIHKGKAVPIVVVRIKDSKYPTHIRVDEMREIARQII